MGSLSEILWEYGVDIFDSEGAVDEINAIIEQESEKRADEKTEVKFKERMQEEELRRKKENEKNVVRSLAINTYKKHYLQDEISINGELITASNYFAKNAKQIPGYANQKLVYNECIGSWEIHNKNGNRNIVSDFHAIFVVIVMKSSECEAVVVQLDSSGKTRSYTFDYDDFMSRRILKSMPLESRNLGVSNELLVESFYSSIKLCPNVQFFTIPEKSGWILTEGKNIDFVSSDSVCPQLEKFYSSDIKERILVPTDRTFEKIIKEYSGLTMKNQEIVFKIIIRVMSLLLPFFDGEGLKPDRIFVIESKDDKNAQEIIGLVKTKNYDSTTVPSLTEYVTNIRSELQSINDGTVVFRDSELIEKNRERKNALEENYKELLQCNGTENVSRKVVIIVTDIPGCIPEDYPAYYLSATDSMNIDDIRKVQRLSGEFDYSLIKFIIENNDVAGNLIQNAMKAAKRIENEVGFEDESSSGIMMLATALFLRKLRIVSNSNLKSIIKWLKNDANCGAATSTSIINGFSCAISSAIKSGALNVTKQFGPPYYDSDGQNVFVARDDMSINLEDDTLKNIIMPQIKMTNKKNKVCRALKEEGLLYGTKDNKRDLKVSFKSGLEKRLRVYSFSLEVLDSECQQYVYDLNNSGYFFSPDSIPTGLFPVISNADGTKLAGIRISPDTDENLHTYSSGTTRSGKTFELVQQALLRAEKGDKIIIFDHTGAFTEQELLKHQSKEIIDKFFSFWNLYTDGFPVDMLELRDCLNYKDKKERLVRMYAAGARALGDYQEKILAAAVKSFLKKIRSDSEPNICDILDLICEDDKTDDAHEKLLYKLDSVLDDFHETPVTKSNWSEFLDTQNPVVVISTGYDSVGKGTQAIDMLLENLYAFKQRYPDKRYTVIIDEVQDQYLSEKGPINILLRKGGKHNLSMLLASQEFPDENTALGKVVGNCGTVKIYIPKQDNLKRVSQFTGVDQTVLNSLHQGECIVCGSFYSCYEGKNCIAALKGKSVKYSSDFGKRNNDN